MAEIVNGNIHAGNQDPEPWEGGSEVPVLTPTEEVKGKIDKLINIIRQNSTSVTGNGTHTVTITFKGVISVTIVGKDKISVCVWADGSVTVFIGQGENQTRLHYDSNGNYVSN